MPLLRDFAGGLRDLFRQNRNQQELNEELQGFLEAAIAEKMREGMNHEQALRAARIEMGSAAAVHDQVRGSGWESGVESVWQDLRYGVRMLSKNPGFTALAVLTLALGMGATTTVFGWIDAVLLHPFPGIAHPERIVALETLTPNGEAITTSYPDYRDFRDHLTSFSGIAVARHTSVSVGEADDAERIPAQFVSGNFFDVLEIKPALGRFFAPAEQGDQPHAFPLAVISYRLWQSHFNSDFGIIGKTIKVNEHVLAVIGVTPPEFHGSMPGLAYDIWIPNVMRPMLNGFTTDWQLTDRHNRDLIAFARLKTGTSIEQARAEIAALAHHLAEIHPDVSEGIGATILPMWEGHFGAQSWLLAPLEILMAACAVVLLIVCANVANLLLARFTTRQKEFSMRLALGAKRSRLFRQLLTESLVLAIFGALAGVLIAVWAGRSLHHLLPPGQLHTVALDLSLNRTVLGFTAALCVATTLLCGLVPAFHSVRVNLHDSLKESGRSGAAGQKSHRMRGLLVLSEVSLALVAMIGAGLCVRSFRTAAKIDPGFEPENVLLSQFYLATNGYNLQQRKEFSYRLREKLESQPGVVSVAYSDGVPLGFEPSWWEELQIKSYVPAPEENMLTYRNVVSPGYFQLMQIPLVEGRDFTEHDDTNSAAVMIVNQSFVKRYLGHGLVMGRQVHGWGNWFTIVGVVKDSKYNFLTETSVPYFYVPFRQIYRADMYLAFYVRTHGEPSQSVGMLRSAVRAVDPNVTTFDVLPLSQYVGGSLYPQKIAADFLTVLAVLALLLAALGLYSVMAYSVAQRTHEIGVRIALGAQRANVFGLVLRHAMALTVMGLIFGAVMATVLSRQASAIHIAGSLMGGAGTLLTSGANSPVIYAAAAAFLCFIAALASYIPARRATKVDPLVALRDE